MANYHEVTSSLEGRLLVQKGRVKQNPLHSLEDLFRSEDSSRTYTVLLRAAALRLPEAHSKELHKDGNIQEIKPFLKKAKPVTQHPFGKLSTPSIVLAEPVLYVQGYNKVHARAHTSPVVRGYVQFPIVPGENIKSLKVRLSGVSITEWPEAWRLKDVSKVDRYEFARKEVELKKDDLQVNNQVLDFELPVSSVIPETIDLLSAQVQYQLGVIVDGVQVCEQDLKVVRTDCLCSLESSEPWCVTGRQDGIRYCFLFHSSSFNVGSDLPMTVRLSHTSEVTWHSIEVRLVEDISYGSINGKAIRLQSRDKGILHRQEIGGPIRTASQIDVEQLSAAAKNVPVAAVNMLPLGLKSLTAHSVDVGKRNTPEVVVMDERLDLRLPPCSKGSPCTTIHPATTYSPISVRHFLKIIILVSRSLGPGREMTYELVVRIPIHVLSCNIRESDILLPAYRTVAEQPAQVAQNSCGCSLHRTVSETSEPFDVERYWFKARKTPKETELPQYADCHNSR